MNTKPSTSQAARQVACVESGNTVRSSESPPSPLNHEDSDDEESLLNANFEQLYAAFIQDETETDPTQNIPNAQTQTDSPLEQSAGPSTEDTTQTPNTNNILLSDLANIGIPQDLAQIYIDRFKSNMVEAIRQQYTEDQKYLSNRGVPDEMIPLLLLTAHDHHNAKNTALIIWKGHGDFVTLVKEFSSSYEEAWQLFKESEFDLERVQISLEDEANRGQAAGKERLSENDG